MRNAHDNFPKSNVMCFIIAEDEGNQQFEERERECRHVLFQEELMISRLEIVADYFLSIENRVIIASLHVSMLLLAFYSKPKPVPKYCLQSRY